MRRTAVHFRALQGMPYEIMTTLIATSVIRGSQQGDSHGGVYLIDLENLRVKQTIDWNDASIDWHGRGWDRGLRGIAFDDERVFIAASDELFVYTPDFELLTSFRSPYLKHCHEIYRYKRRLFVTSTGFDAILGFDLDQNRFSFGLHVSKQDERFVATPFDPNDSRGPAESNDLHLNNVFCDGSGMYIAGLKTEALLAYRGNRLEVVRRLPAGCHNARPFRDGIVLNDSAADSVRFIGPENERVFEVPTYDKAQLAHADLDDSRIARQGFGRGLCAITDSVLAAGSSPSTIALHDLDSMKTVAKVNLTMDMRNAIHGLELWPYLT